jgi:hypothetical protein
MKAALNRSPVGSSSRFYDSTIQQFNNLTGCLALVLCTLFFSLSARAQFSMPAQNSARSVSGQFIASGIGEISRLARSPLIAADTNLVRLEPALLVVSAERIKESLWRALEIKSTAPWRGQIHFVLHPAQTPDEGITIVSQPLNKVWNYRVELPDVLPRVNFTRALTAALLLEYANRNAQSHSAEVPAWLTDGLSQQLLAAGSPETVLSAPDKTVNDLPMTRVSTDTSGMDARAAARRVLKNSPALTFEQLSWPTDEQLSGGDDGVYRASAQLFAGEILKLKNGPADLRATLETLPQFYNWQLAFQSAFRGIFPRPLDLEKWWALSVVSFISLDPGPGWTLEVSQKKLDDILRVPVETRVTKDSLPVHAEISLQAVIRNWDAAHQAAILQTKLRDLELAQLRMAPSLAALTEGYRRALAGYLGDRRPGAPRPSWMKHMFSWVKKTSASTTLKTLDALDARRRMLETPAQPIRPVQPGGGQPT